MIFKELVHSCYPHKTKRPMGHTTSLHIQRKLGKVRNSFDEVKLDRFIKQKQKNNQRKKVQNLQALKNKFTKTNTQHKKLINLIKQIPSDDVQFLNEALNLLRMSQFSKKKRSPFGSFFNKNSHLNNSLQTEFLKLNLNERSSEPKPMGVISQKNKKKIRKLKKRISQYKNLSSNNKNNQSNHDHSPKQEKKFEPLKKKIECKQNNLKNLIWNNNRLRVYLHDQQNMKKNLSNKLIEFTDHSSLNSEESDQLKKITKQKKQQQINALTMEIKKIQFNTKNTSRRLLEKSNSSLKQKLKASKLQLLTLQKEEKRLEIEMRKLVTLKKSFSAGNQFENKLRLSSSTSTFFQDYFEKNIISTDESEQNSEESEKNEKTSPHISKIRSNSRKVAKKSRVLSSRSDLEFGITLQEKFKLENEKKKENKENNNATSEETELNKKLYELDQIPRENKVTRKLIIANQIPDREEKQDINTIKNKNKDFSIDSVEKLLTIPVAVEYFTEYLNHEMCQENLLFFLSVKNFKNLLNSNQMEKKIISMSKKIYKKYIKTGSLFQVNIDYICREKINSLVKKKEFSIDMFNEAQEIVFGHMNNDQLIGFKNSDLYSQLLKKIQTRNELYFDTIIKKATIISRNLITRALNIDFWYTGKAENALLVSYKLLNNLIQILNAHYLINCAQIDLNIISQSISFNRFVASTTELQKVKLEKLTNEQRLCFFLNIYNTLLIHGGVVNGIPNRGKEYENLTQNTMYRIGGLDYSLSDIRYGILHSNRDKKLNQYFKQNDPRIQFVIKNNNDHRLNFAIISFESTSIFLQTYIPDQLELFLEKNTKLQLAKEAQFIKNKIILPPRIKILLKDFDDSSLLFIKYLLPYLGIKRQKFIKNMDYKINISFRKNSNFLPMFSLESESILVKKYSDEYKF
ncbi:electron carrier/ protein disulfide oxidoreductase [Anaeramoeba flamelloides]|uniref:Electron carrier/ protein disulfide oxidoreductase n=1 Tax=Anaeramoeba flamelloides TaxID=1746091 RepID=A0AAV8AAY0_9EUKA|nr:electron carrier/ protein disulfide oxidoreductase [Anaeramoeba flamelloides]